MFWLLALWLAQTDPLSPQTVQGATAETRVAPPLAVGTVLPSIACLDDPTHSYALYLPSSYSPDKAWPVIFAFDPGARGTTPVTRYQQAAERYGYIIAGSNDSRNGMPNVLPAISAMTRDVAARLHLDPKRVYTAGMSGGARLAFAVALSAPGIAGVLASSAALPDSRPEKTLPFAVFATAGTEDFNLLELRELDRTLTTPHHLAMFEGGHVWLSSDLAMEAVEWMELMAMKSGMAQRNPTMIAALFQKRVASVAATSDRKERYLALQAIATDFDGLVDVASVTSEATELGRDAKVRDALKRDRDLDIRERALLIEIFETGQMLTTDERREALDQLRRHWKDLSQKAQTPNDSPERRLARRILGTLAASIRTDDPEYQKIIAQYRLTRR
jgi:dienelactone hydrolase